MELCDYSAGMNKHVWPASITPFGIQRVKDRCTCGAWRQAEDDYIFGFQGKVKSGHQGAWADTACFKICEENHFAAGPSICCQTFLLGTSPSQIISPENMSIGSIAWPVALPQAIIEIWTWFPDDRCRTFESNSFWYPGFIAIIGLSIKIVFHQHPFQQFKISSEHLPCSHLWSSLRKRIPLWSDILGQRSQKRYHQASLNIFPLGSTFNDLQYFQLCFTISYPRAIKHIAKVTNSSPFQIRCSPMFNMTRDLIFESYSITSLANWFLPFFFSLSSWHTPRSSLLLV